MTKKLTMSWEDFNHYMNDILSQIEKSKKKYKSIYSIPRGGLIPGVWLSHHLDIPMIFSRNQIHENILIVDDILDSGNTMSEFMRDLKIIPDIAVIVLNTTSKIIPTYHSFLNARNEYIYFSWESIDIEDNVSIVKPRN